MARARWCQLVSFGGLAELRSFSTFSGVPVREGRPRQWRIWQYHVADAGRRWRIGPRLRISFRLTVNLTIILGSGLP